MLLIQLGLSVLIVIYTKLVSFRHTSPFRFQSLLKNVQTARGVVVLRGVSAGYSRADMLTITPSVKNMHTRHH